MRVNLFQVVKISLSHLLHFSSRAETSIKNKHGSLARIHEPKICARLNRALNLFDKQPSAFIHEWRWFGTKCVARPDAYINRRSQSDASLKFMGRKLKRPNSISRPDGEESKLPIQGAAGLRLAIHSATMTLGRIFFLRMITLVHTLPLRCNVSNGPRTQIGVSPHGSRVAVWILI